MFYTIQFQPFCLKNNTTLSGNNVYCQINTLFVCHFHFHSNLQMSDVVTALKLSSDPPTSNSNPTGGTTSSLEADQSALDNEPGKEN